MIPQLASSFGATALGACSILVLYCYTYSTASLIARAGLDHFGTKSPHWLALAIPARVAGDAGRLLPR